MWLGNTSRAMCSQSQLFYLFHNSGENIRTYVGIFELCPFVPPQLSLFFDAKSHLICL